MITKRYFLVEYRFVIWLTIIGKFGIIVLKMNYRENTMLNFRKITIEDKELIKSFYSRKNYYLCAYSFTTTFMWQSNYQREIAVSDGILYSKYTVDNGNVYFCPPMGEGDYSKAIQKLAEYASANGQPLNFGSIPKDYIEKIEQSMPGVYEFVYDRDSADYIYTSESLMYLKGKKLHGKRNHINKFLNTYSDWSYEELTDANTKEFFDFHVKWCENVGSDSFLGETCALAVALKNREALDIKGALLRVNRKIAAITLGSESFEDTFIVHIEKADSDIDGAYQMINQQFAQHNFGKYKYIDREEDMGIEGLRKAKLSYHPEFLSEIYYTVLKSELIK